MNPKNVESDNDDDDEESYGRGKSDIVFGYGVIVHKPIHTQVGGNRLSRKSEGKKLEASNKNKDNDGATEDFKVIMENIKKLKSKRELESEEKAKKTKETERTELKDLNPQDAGNL
jgi:hypothetical protein